MSEWLAWVLVAPLAYLVGSIPVGIIIGKMWGGVDPREHGSGSMGATNVLRTMGKKAAISVFVLDFGKGAAVVGLAKLMASDAFLLHGLAGTLVIIGHTFPVFAGFKGGKGIAVGWAALLVLSPITAIATLIGLAIAALTRYVSLGSMIGAGLGVVFLIVIAVVKMPVDVLDAPMEYLVFAVPALALILFSHRENMVRLIRGTESKIDINAAEGGSTSGGRGA